MRLKRELETMPVVREVEPEFTDVPGAAAWAHVSCQHIRRLLTEKKLARYKFFSRTLIKFEELRALVKVQR